MFEQTKYVNNHKIFSMKNSNGIILTKPLKLINAEKNDTVRVEVTGKIISITLHEKNKDDEFKYVK